jgi:DNA primase
MTKDDELERFKALNLGELAASYGYELNRRESSRSSLVMRHADGDKIIIATGEDGHAVFFSVHANASGSVIDFIMHREGGNLGYARKTLRAYVPSSFPTAHAPHIPKPNPIAHDRAALIAQWHRLNLYTGGYLESRGLTAATVAAFAERLRIDQRGNVVFRHDDREGLTGWEIKNKGFTGFASGGRKALFACRLGIAREDTPARLILAESALDAMSYHQLNPDAALVLSFGGGLSPEQETLLRYVLTQYQTAKVITATDADAGGDRYAALIEAIRPDAVRAQPPTGKDWNDALPHSGQAQLLNLSP